jgi:ATP-dependent Clp protease protease subunit
MPNFWKFINKAASETEPESAELRIEGEIISDDDAWICEWLGIKATSPNTFKAELTALRGKPITVWIDSYGGDVFAAAGIYNALKEHDAPVTVKVDGKAMSAASVIAMAGSSILMSPVAIMMIHNPLTYAEGDMHDLRHVADVLDAVKDTIVNAYQIKTKKSRTKIAEMMDNETWMSAKAAVKDGFADGMMYADSTESVTNFAPNMLFNRLAIQNSAKAASKRLIDLGRQQNDPPDSVDVLKAKMALQMEL